MPGIACNAHDKEKRRWQAFVALLVAAVLALGVLYASGLLGPWLRFAYGPRPMFSEWRFGDRGWGWRRNYAIDDEGRILLFDRYLNYAVLVVPETNSHVVSITTDSAGARFTNPQGESWTIGRDTDAVVIAIGSAPMMTFPVLPGFVERLAKSIPYPEGGFDGDLCALMREQEGVESLMETWAN